MGKAYGTSMRVMEAFGTSIISEQNNREQVIRKRNKRDPHRKEESGLLGEEVREKRSDC
jgi:hypothetical protein